MSDGLYQVSTSYLCAGFTVKDGRVDLCAPILRKRLAYWMRIAVWISLLTSVTMATPLKSSYEIAAPYLKQWHELQAQRNMPEYEKWLRGIFGKYIKREFADFHHDFWKHTWGIQKDVKPDPIDVGTGVSYRFLCAGCGQERPSRGSKGAMSNPMRRRCAICVAAKEKAA